MGENISMNHYNLNEVSHNNGACAHAQDAIFYSRIWGIDEVCSFTSYAKGTVYNLVSRGEIPYRKRGGGRRLVFIPSEIIEWFKGEL